MGALAEVVAVAVRGANVGCHGNGAGEPEDGGNDEQTERDHGMVGASEKARRQGEVEENEDRPDGAEEHEGEGRRSVAPPAAVGVVDDCEQEVSKTSRAEALGESLP